MANTPHYPAWSNRRDVVTIAGNCVGGSAAVTKAEGHDFAVEYVSTGIYRITFDQAYAEMLAFTASLQAATPGDIKGHTIIADTLSAKVIDVHVFNASDTLHDLAANEWFHFVAVFRNTDSQ